MYVEGNIYLIFNDDEIYSLIHVTLKLNFRNKRQTSIPR
jgi:hypothetical protein